MHGGTVGTKAKILEAAKRHFAEFGLQHASIRAITRLAGVNSALLRYHFGSKRELYEAVVRETAHAMIAERVAMLEQLRQQFAGDPIPLAELLRAYCRPILMDAADSSRDAAIYLRFFGRMYTEPSDELREITQSQFTHLQLLYLDEIARTVPNVPRSELIFRFGLMIGALTFLGSKTGVIEILSDGKVDSTDEQLSVDLFVAAYSALFEAPTGERDARNRNGGISAPGKGAPSRAGRQRGPEVARRSRRSG